MFGVGIGGSYSIGDLQEEEQPQVEEELGHGVVEQAQDED